jgi:hypothetical protein
MTYKPKRVARPSIIADAASTLLAQVEISRRISDAERDRWTNAVAKAFAQLIDGVRFEQDGNNMIFPSRTRSGLSHRVNGICDCEAAEGGMPCWHRAAKRMIELIIEAEQATLITPPNAPPSCGRCGTGMFEQAGRQICPACSHSPAQDRAPRRLRRAAQPRRKPKTRSTNCMRSGCHPRAAASRRAGHKEH